ncbi:MAG TPA: Nif3-like dinuclear metal center hexameric protein [Actinomycetota bacterium]|nr:Nif3-like dinuclear metal center hexameric protein [Actinomycetota bacterium]
MAPAPSVSDRLAVIDGLFPPSWAEPWDNVGLQLGDRHAAAERVLVALDPTIDVIREAAGRGCGLLVTHHPLVFEPLRSLDLAAPLAGAVAEAIRSGVAVAACHTNADVARPGVSDALAEALDLRVEGVLRPTTAGRRVKVTTFVPPEATEKVLDAMAAAGGGRIGEYSACSFRVRGTGTFVPSAAADPAVGERGTLNQVEEDRLEMVVPGHLVGPLVAAMIEAHPYEEVAYDVVPLEGGEELGLGRITRTEDAISAGDLLERCRERLGPGARIVGDVSRPLTTIAVCGGSGTSLIPDALAADADAFVTGDVKHHQALDAIAAGLVLIDAGHHATEWPFVLRLAARLRGAMPDAEILLSETRTEPFAP